MPHEAGREVTPEISVVMGVRDDACHVAATVDSVLAQAGVDLEFIIVDDGSSDDTPEILRRIARRDPRVRVLEQEGAGLTMALIRGCGEARGAFIARQDSGDLSRPGRLLKQRDALGRDPDLAFVSCWTEFRGPEMEFLYRTEDRGHAREPTELIEFSEGTVALTDGPTSHPSVVFRKDAYVRAGGYRAAFHFAQDKDLWYRLAEVGRYQTVPEMLYVARVLPRGTSLSSGKIQRAFGRAAHESFLARMTGEEEAAILTRAEQMIRPRRVTSRQRLADGAYFVGESLRRNGDSRCREYFHESLRTWPFQMRSLLRLFQSTWSGDQ